MQTSTSRPGSLVVPQKSSARKLKTLGSDSTSVSSPNPNIKTAKDPSPKTGERRLPRAPPTEKKRQIKASESEPRILQLQEELKKTKEQLSSSESWKRRAQQEAEEAKRNLAAMSAELEESHNQLKELSESEEARLQELRKLSQERDRAWQSEIEAFQKQYSMDSAALASAMNEIQKLKMQLDRVSQSEAAQARHAESAHGEIQSLRVELTETLVLVEKLKNQLNDSREYEARALEEASRAEMQLETVKTAESELKLEHDSVVDSYDSLLLELEQSNSRVKSLEELVASLRSDLDKSSSNNGECEESESLETEVNTLKSEVNQLRSALVDAERRYRDEYIQSTLQIRNAYQLVELTRSESSQKEAELDTKLRESRADVEELRAKLLIEKENSELNSKLEENQPAKREAELDHEHEHEHEHELEFELKRSESALEVLKASLLDKEALLQSMEEENEKLKHELMKTATERSRENDEALTLAESSRAAEKEALMRVDSLTEEADKSCKKAARVIEQLDAAQASNSELEGELRRLKVQCDQWRKAAEAAAAMLSTSNNNGKYGERRGSFDYHSITSKLGSPQSDDTDDDSPKKKNGNMLKKIGVLLKKGHK